MSLFKGKQNGVIGVDVSSASVKLLELSRNGAGYKVENYAVEPLPAAAVNEKAIADPDAVGETLRRAIQRAGAKTKNCAMAVSGSAVITKVITLPAGLNEEEMEAQIQLVADQYIPYALEEVNLDFDLLGPTENNPETVDVLLAASRSENVDMRVAAAEVAGLTAKIMDVEAYAAESVFSHLTEMLPEGGRDKTVAVIDIGSAVTSLVVLSDQRLIYTREQPFGGAQLTEDIMQRYGLSYEEAGLAKKEGGLPDTYEADVLEPFKETLTQQVNRFLQFFYSASQYTGVDHIVLAGGCAAIPGIDKQIEKRLGTPTTVADPFARMAIASRINKQRLRQDAPAMMIACGLALRSFD